MGSPRQENCSRSLFTSPGELYTPGIKPASPALTLRILSLWATWETWGVFRKWLLPFLIISSPLESPISCHLPSPLYGSSALRNQQKKKKNPKLPLDQMERTLSSFLPFYPSPLALLHGTSFPFTMPQPPASLICCDHSFSGGCPSFLDHPPQLGTHL